MNVNPLGLSAAALPSSIPTQRVPVSSGQLLPACRLAWERGGLLAAMWASDERDRDGGFAAARRAARRRRPDRARAVAAAERPDAVPTSARIFPAANRMQRAAFDLVGVASEADDQRPWLWMASWPIDRFPLRRDFEASPKWEPGRRITPSSASPARACTRFRSARCTRASSSRGTSASRSSARRCCGWKSGWATCTRASRSASSRCRSPKGHRLAGRVSGDCTVAYALGVRAGRRGDRRRRRAAARAVAARAAARARAHRQPPGRPRRPRQRRRLRVRPRAVLAPQGGRAARQPRGCSATGS